ncbi:uncharacterized protein [Lepeophtheirus salmonis]|uniref:uncharacterized protein isoform X6 n=1 Tax=Lepeophtheirus salmonis TaxID=72036 RepID=UPI003AF3CD07
MFLNPWYSGQQRQVPETPSSQKPKKSVEAPSSITTTTTTSVPLSQHSLSDNDDEELKQHSPYLSAVSRSRYTVQNRLGAGWTVHLSPEGRFYYCNHLTQSSGWLPPSDSWDSVSNGIISLPYGWEIAQDKEGRTYYVNHINKTTSYDDPRKWELESEPDPEPRSIELLRDSEMGFGFVAGSEKPVIVRFVTSGGPSVKKLMPGDQILQINGEDVKLAPRDHVIQLVRNCKEKVSLIVCQPPLDNSSTRKSAILSAAKKAKLKNNPSRVRFAESVDINGFNDDPPSSDSVVPLMPNVLKVFLENGQTKSFKYDASTTVNDVIESLQAKLGLKSINHFSLVVEHIKSLRRNKLTLLDPKERLSQIASRPGAHNLRCLFRVTFVPSDASELLRSDPVAFEYLYVQSCNDVVQERFAPELQYDIALRLAALQIHQHVLSTSGSSNSSNSSSSSSIINNGILSSKMAIKTVEKECGLDRFIPTSLRDTMKRKELRKLLTHFLKLNSSQSNNLLGNTPKSQMGHQQIQTLTALQAKLHYLKIIGELPSYGAKCFSTNISDSNVETVILISPKFGISQINSLRNSVLSNRRLLYRHRTLSCNNPFRESRVLEPLNLCDIEQVTSIVISKEDEISRKVDIQLKDPDKENIVLSLEERDAKELVLVLHGYYKLITHRSLDVIVDEEEDEEESSLSTEKNWTGLNNIPSVEEESPPYCNKHQVRTNQGWNYPKSNMGDTKYAVVDFGAHPPYHPPPDSFRINQMNHNSSDSGSDGDASMASNNTSGEQNNIMDRNSNNITRFENFNNAISSSSPKHLNTFIQNNINNNSNHISNTNLIRPNGILKKPSRTLSPQNTNLQKPYALSSSPNMNFSNTHRNNLLYNNINNINVNKTTSEKRTNETLERLTEMKELVADAEEYLTDTTDSRNNDSELSPTNYGKLKHSDSLILLAQNIGDGKGGYYVPSNNSANEAVNKSILLSSNKSPLKDVLLMSCKDSDSEASTPTPSPARFSTTSAGTVPPAPPPPPSSASRLKPSDSSFGLHSPDNFPLGFDPKEENGVRDLLKKLKTNSKEDFASGNLVLDPDLIDLTMIPPPMTPDEDGVYRVFPGTTNPVSTPPTPFADRQTLEAELKALERESPCGMISSSNHLEVGSRNLCGEWKSAYKQGDRRTNPGDSLNNIQRSSNYLPGNKDFDNFIANVTIPPPPSGSNAKDTTDIASYIIPPPPSSPMKSRSSSSTLPGTQEIAPKIANLQKRLAHLTSPERSHPPPLPPPSITTTTELKMNLSHSPQSTPHYESGLPKAGHVLSQAEFFNKNGVVAEMNGHSNTPPPPPPPRSAVIPPKKSQGLISSPFKLSSTPSTDSMSSSSSSSSPTTIVKKIEKCRSIEHEDDEPPPSLPPRGTSMSPPPLSPSKPPLRFSPKPALPARSSRPGRTIPSDLKPPTLPAKTLSSADRLNGRKLPTPLHPPPLPSKEEEFVCNTSVDEEDIWNTRATRSLVFKKAEKVVSDVVDHIKESEELCDLTHHSSGSEEDYRSAKERLTNESRQFVTASKLFVKSATESEGQLMDCLNHCIQMIDRIGSVTREVVLSSPYPNSGTRDLISKVRDVAETYLATVEAAAGSTSASGEIHDPNMNILMKRATSLASVLTTLMRSLRVFN